MKNAIKEFLQAENTSNVLESLDNIEKAQKDKAFNDLWNKLGDIPTNENNEIELDFIHFKAGTDLDIIWQWLEGEFSVTLGDFMYNL